MNLGRVAAYEPTTIEAVSSEAAVLVPVIEHEAGVSLLFTKRADHLGEHASQMSFPGGSREPSDGSRYETALREATEEIGLRQDEVDFVGRLDDIHTVTGYVVSPFVARVPDREYDPDEREVAEVVLLTVDDLLDPANIEVERREHPAGGEVLVHFFHVDGYTVWGATGRILVQLLELTTDWRAPTSPDHVIDPETDPR